MNKNLIPFRIGNTIQDEGVQYKIEEILVKNKKYWVTYDKGKTCCRVDNVERVLLTDQVLIDRGFTIEEDSFEISKAHIGKNPITHDFTILLTKTGRNWFYRNSHHELYYLDQLENLMFLLDKSLLTVDFKKNERS